jgi:hypothetical protein
MTMPALQQPIAATHRPATARNAQFRTAPPGIVGERSAVPNGGSATAPGLLLFAQIAPAALPKLA